MLPVHGRRQWESGKAVNIEDFFIVTKKKMTRWENKRKGI